MNLSEGSFSNNDPLLKISAFTSIDQQAPGKIRETVSNRSSMSFLG